MLLASMFVSGPALAGDGVAANGWGLPVVLAVLAGLVAVGGALGLAWWSHRRLRAALGEIAWSNLGALRWHELVAAAPDGYYCWDDLGGTEICSSRLAVLLELPAGTASGIAEIAARIALADRPAVEAAIESLRSEGIGFDLVVSGRDGQRSFQLMAARAVDAEGTGLADIMWVRDISESEQVSTRLEAQVALLAEENQRSRCLLDMLPIPIWTRDSQLNLTTCNPAYAAAVDAATPEAAIAEGREIAVGVLPLRGKGLAERARAEGGPQSENVHVVVAGARRLLEITELPADGDSLAGFALDSTRLEEAQQELARHIAAHGGVLENLATAIAIFGPDARLKFFNAAYLKLWGLDEGWLWAEPSMGEILEALREQRRLPEYADFPAFKKEQLKLFTSLIDPIEDLVHLPDGTTLRRVVTAHPFGGLLFTYEDVTDALALERSYNTLIAVQRETLDNLYEGVAVVSGDGRLRLYNPAFARIWDLSDEVLAAEPHIAELAERIRPFYSEGDDWQVTKQKILAMVGNRLPKHGRIEREDGVVLYYSTVPLPDGGVLFSYLDVTDTARVERALRERNEALRTANRLKSEFIANLSHELRTPLTTIAGFSEVLTNQYFGRLNPRQQEYCQSIQDTTRQLQLLISDIIDLATIEAGQMALELDTVDIHDLFTAVLSLTREQMRVHGLRLEMDCAEDIGWVVADERRLKQVLFSLLSGAVRYTPTGGIITLSAWREPESVMLQVSDTGMSRAVRPSSLDEDETLAHHEGSLGLSLVKSFLELHGGSVTVESSSDTSTRVVCRLPAGNATGL